MKKVLFLLVLMCLEKALHAQYVYTIKADSVKITNTCDTAELIIENHTQTVPGFLFNRGRGRTEFRRIAQLDDTSVVVGGDTIHLGRGNRNFANADLTFDADHWHDGALHEGGLYNFNQIGFQVNDADFNSNADMSLSQNNGYLLYMSKYAGNNKSYSSSQKVGYGNVNMGIDNRDNGVISQTSMNLRESQWGVYGNYLNTNTGESYSGHLTYDFDITDDRSDMHLGVSNGNILIQTGDRRPGVDKNLAMLLNNSDSITFYAISWPDTITRFIQTREGFAFKRLGNNNDFRIVGLPVSASSTDSMLVVDNNGQLKKRPQIATRKSATVTADTYTVPADVDVVFLNYTGGTATITLPTGTLDREITIKNLNTTNSIALSGLDASESNTIATRGAITVKYTGSAWVGISKY